MTTGCKDIRSRKLFAVSLSRHQSVKSVDLISFSQHCDFGVVVRFIQILPFIHERGRGGGSIEINIAVRCGGGGSKKFKESR